VVERGKTRIQKHLKVLEDKILGRFKFIASDHYSFADVVAFEVFAVALLSGTSIEEIGKHLPKLGAYLKKIKEEIPHFEKIHKEYEGYRQYLSSQGTKFVNLF